MSNTILKEKYKWRNLKKIKKNYIRNTNTDNNSNYNANLYDEDFNDENTNTINTDIKNEKNNNNNITKHLQLSDIKKTFLCDNKSIEDF